MRFPEVFDELAKSLSLRIGEEQDGRCLPGCEFSIEARYDACLWLDWCWTQRICS